MFLEVTIKYALSHCFSLGNTTAVASVTAEGCYKDTLKLCVITQNRDVALCTYVTLFSDANPA
jgi:hypothetical protein